MFNESKIVFYIFCLVMTDKIFYTSAVGSIIDESLCLYNYAAIIIVIIVGHICVCIFVFVLY